MDKRWRNLSLMVSVIIFIALVVFVLMNINFDFFEDVSDDCGIDSILLENNINDSNYLTYFDLSYVDIIALDAVLLDCDSDNEKLLFNKLATRYMLLENESDLLRQTIFSADSRFYCEVSEEIDELLGYKIDRGLILSELNNFKDNKYLVFTNNLSSVDEELFDLMLNVLEGCYE